MSVERDHAARIAQLARLHFEPEELDRLTEELNRILEHVEQLETVERTASGLDDAVQEAQAWRRPATRGSGAESPDELGASPSSLAPEWRDGFFLVPPLPGVHEGESE